MSARMVGLFLGASLVLTACTGADEESAPPPADPGGGVSDHATSSPAAAPDTAPEQKVAKGKDQSFALKNQPGSTRGCVRVGDEVSVRSGGFLAGPWDQFADGVAGRPVSMYVVPSHARGMAEVTVKGTAGGDHFSVASSTVGEAGKYHFYAVDVDRPASGRWKITADAGELSGCWLVQVS